MAIDQQATGKASAASRQEFEQGQTAEEKVRSRLKAITEEKTLAKKFGIGLNSTRNDYSDEEWKLVPLLAREIHAAWIDSWSGESKRSSKTKFRAYRFFLGSKSAG